MGDDYDHDDHDDDDDDDYDDYDYDGYDDDDYGDDDDGEPERTGGPSPVTGKESGFCGGMKNLCPCKINIVNIIMLIVLMMTHLNSSSRQILFDGQAKVMFNRGGQSQARGPGGRADLIGVILGVAS